MYACSSPPFRVFVVVVVVVVVVGLKSKGLATPIVPI